MVRFWFGARCKQTRAIRHQANVWKDTRKDSKQNHHGVTNVTNVFITCQPYRGNSCKCTINRGEGCQDPFSPNTIKKLGIDF